MDLNIDLHYHSKYSDGTSSIIKIENKCLQNNCGVAITDHNEIRGSIKLFERRKVPTILAMEASTKEGIEFLIYFKKVEDFIFFYKSQVEPFRYKRFIVKTNNSAYNILECASSLDTFISLAHPYCGRRKSVKFHEKNIELLNTIFNKIDAVEIFNQKMSIKKNMQAVELQEKLKKKFTVGSDGHDIKSLCDASITIKIKDSLNYNNLYDKLCKNDFERINSDGKKRLARTASVISGKHAAYFLTKGFFNARIKTKS